MGFTDEGFGISLFKDNKTIYDYFEETKNDFNYNNGLLEVVIKDGQLNTNNIIEYVGDTIKQFEFRPDNYEQFIGQEEAKERALTILKKNKRGLKSHFLVDGIKGHGKTTFVKILAKQLNAHLIERIGKQLNEDSIVEIINEINTSKEKNVVLFIDEIDTADWKIIKLFNPIIESFEIAGKKIKPFIFAGATINKHLLLQHNPDTLDRIPTHIKFKRYNSIEILQIIEQYIAQLYADETIDTKALIMIAENCKFNPRTAISLLEDYIVEKNITKVLSNCNIIKKGLTNIDIKLLTILNESTRPVGANALAMKCGLSQNEYITEFEPYLCEYGYINRVPSRIISIKGKELLNELSNNN